MNIRCIPLLLLLLLFTACSNSVPSKEFAASTLKKVMPLEFSIQKIETVKGIPGLCQVIVFVKDQPMVFYMDKKGQYVVSGNILEAATQRNLTIEALQALKTK